MKYSSALQLALLACWTTSNESFNLFGIKAKPFRNTAFVIHATTESEQDKSSSPHPPDGPPPTGLLGEGLHFASRAEDVELETDKIRASSSSDAITSSSAVNGDANANATVAEPQKPLISDETREKMQEEASKAGKQFVDGVVVSYIFRKNYYIYFWRCSFSHSHRRVI
jgi:hypothetical protein